MTDQEIVCEFMEAKPPNGGIERGDCDADREYWWYESAGGWWKSALNPQFNGDTPGRKLLPIYLTLDRLRLVESRLTEEQWLGYRSELLRDCCDSTFDMMRFRAAVHADTEQKIKALAAVLRPEVERASLAALERTK